MKPPTEKSPKPPWVQGVLLAALICCAVPALAADLQFTPSVAVSEEFNDNILESASDRRSEFVTRFQPGAALVYRTPLLSTDLSYNFDYHDYARGTRGDEQNHYLNLHGRAVLVENFFFLDFSDTLSRVSLDVARDVTTESLFANQTDQNKGSFSPYLLWRLGEKSILKTGYRFTDTSYWDSPGIDKREHKAFAELTHEAVARLSLAAGYSFDRVTTDLVDYDQHDLNGGFKYEWADRSFLFGSIGNNWQGFANGRSVSHLFWNAGISRDFIYLLATLETQVLFAEDPLAVSTKETSYRAKLEKPLHQGSLGISGSYSSYEDPLTGAPDRHRALLSGFWRGELSPSLSATAALTGDKVSSDSLSDYPYHFSGSAGVSYLFNYDVTASLNYSHIEYRHELDSAAGARQINRLILALKKLF